MTYHELSLDTRDYTVGVAPINVYCARSACNVIIPKGTAVCKFDAATFTHQVCPTSNMRNFSAHKQPESRFRFGK